VAEAARPVLADHERDAGLRLSLLRLVDELLEEEGGGGGSGGRAAGALAAGGNAELLLTHLLLPPLVWQAGKVAAAVRFAAITALATALRRGLLPPAVLQRRVEEPGPLALLPLLFACLDEDWYVDVRLAACHVTERLLLAVGPALSHEQRRALYPELHKRLDDSANGVRVAACGALRALAATLPADYCDTNSGYLAAGVIIHMDDSDGAVQEAAAAALEALAAVKPAVVRREVAKARERFRAKHYCDRVLAACAAGP
jgi:dynein assembly factor 5